MIRNFASALVAVMISYAPAYAFSGICGPSTEYDISPLARMDEIDARPVLDWFSSIAAKGVPWTKPATFFRDFPARDVSIIAFVWEGQTCLFALDAKDRAALLEHIPGI